jgi:hypothetical protein
VRWTLYCRAVEDRFAWLDESRIKDAAGRAPSNKVSIQHQDPTNLALSDHCRYSGASVLLTVAIALVHPSSDCNQALVGFATLNWHQLNSAFESSACKYWRGGVGVRSK